jgi:murein endopeptidase
VLVGDLSRPHGGDFGRRFGGLGHASHQNGLDADIYYPRLDRRVIRAAEPSEVNRAAAQELVDAFTRAGAEYVFVGPSLGLHGPRKMVQELAHHDDHLHFRLRAEIARRATTR